MNIINSAVAAIIVDEAIRAEVTQLFANVPQTSSTGGMTLDMGNGPIVVAHGKCSLADEKSIRASLKSLDDKAKLSRTNNVKTRCDQYAIAPNAKVWKQLHAEREEAKEVKKTAGKKQTADKTPEEIVADEETSHATPVGIT